MRYETQENMLAGKIKAVAYDTILPPDARAEMLKPKRPVILEPPRVERSVRRDRSGILRWAGAFALVAIILAGVIGHYSGSLKTPVTPQHSAPVVQPTPALEKPAGEPLATPQPVSQPPGPPPQAVSAPRARLVRLPTPRVDIIELTPEHIDETHVITMRYGTEVLATLRGFLGSETQLPRAGHIGDMWLVGTVPWIWIQVPGTSAPTWVDP